MWTAKPAQQAEAQGCAESIPPFFALCMKQKDEARIAAGFVIAVCGGNRQTTAQA